VQDLTWEAWDLKSVYRGVNRLYIEKVERALDCYGNKIPRLEDQLKEARLKYADIQKIARIDQAIIDEIPEIASIITRLNRLKDKQITCQKEIEGRNLGIFKRTELHSTEYFLDLGAGNDGDTGLSISQAWLHFSRFTETLVKSPGDFATIRANTSETITVDVQFDEDGDQDNYISMIGCDSVNDPWSDGSDVKPIFTANADAYQLYLSGDWFLYFKRIIFKDSTDGAGIVRNDGNVGNYFYLCEFWDCTTCAMQMSSGGLSTFEECIWEDNGGYHLFIATAWARFIKNVFNAGAGGTSSGIYLVSGKVEGVECDFGQTTPHSSADIDGNYRQEDCSLRACKLATGCKTGAGDWDSQMREEDANGVSGAFLMTAVVGTIEKDTTIKTGTVDHSFKMTPTTYVGPNAMLALNNNSLIEFPINEQLTADDEVTLTVKIRAMGAWGTYPVAGELFLEVWYLDHATNPTRTSIKSTAVLSHASNWADFSVTFTPAQTGVAYGTVKLGIYEDAGDGCYVNGETEIT